MDKCATCGDNRVFLRRKGENQVGLYCKGCEKWKKWVGKKEVPAYTSRGYKIYDENYHPESVVPQNVPPMYQDNIPPFMGDGLDYNPFTNMGGAQPSTNNQMEQNMDYTQGSSVSVASPQEKQSISELLKRNQGKEDLGSFDICTLCATGSFQPLAKDSVVSMNRFEDILFVTSKDRSSTLGSFKIKYCPNCGKKLGN